jgi:protein TonB
MTPATARRDEPVLRMLLAVAISTLLHTMLLVALQPEPPSPEQRFSERAVEVTLERAIAAPAAPAAPAAAQAGQDRPAGSIDLVHTALAPGPSDTVAMLQPAPWVSPAALPLPSTGLQSRARLDETVMPAQALDVLAAHELAAAAPAAAPRAPDASDRLQAPPLPQPLRQAPPRQASQQSLAALSGDAQPGEPARRPDTASFASQRQAQQDYVLLVVRKLSQARFFAESPPDANASGGVVARLTVARNGGLTALSLVKESGLPAVDSSIMDTIRRAAPFAPLPAGYTNGSFTFIVPINYAQER